MSDPLIRFDRFTYAYPDGPPVLEDLSWSVEAGEFWLILGPSGSGKSTLLRAVSGLVPHLYGGTVSGRVWVNGQDTRHRLPRDLAWTVGSVFQIPEAHFVARTVEETLLLGLELRGLSPASIRLRLEEVLEAVGIPHLRDRLLETLSGGEAQRVAIAAALALHPQVLVLDEPTSQLDPPGAEAVLAALRHLSEDLGLTLLLVEHRLERVLHHVDRVLALGPEGPRQGGPRELVLDLQGLPPLLELGRRLGWRPLPLTIREGLPHARRLVPRRPLPPDPVPGPPVLRAEGISHTYPDGLQALNDVSLTLGEGECLVLLGRNGSGKTTLLRRLAGLLTGPGRTERSGRVGYLPQQADRILFQERVADELQGRRDLAEALGLLPLWERHPRELSVGERERVALGAVLAAEPQLLLLDEPTRGLDYPAKVRFARFLRTWLREAPGRGVILATHDVELAALCAGRILLLSEGEVAAEGPARRILSEALAFAPQVAKLLRGWGVLTVEEALVRLGMDGGRD